MKRLLLAGGGHAHLSVLQALARENLNHVEVTLVTPSLHQNYSGMLPGWMAGHYTLEQCRIDLQALADAAGIMLICASIVGMDAARRCVVLSDGRQLEYDVLSLDVGSETDVSWLEMAGEKLLPVKPLDAFFDAWPKLLTAAKEHDHYRLAIVGGGAAGVELALAARHAFTGAGITGDVDLVASDAGVLAGYAAGVQRRAIRYLVKASVKLHTLKAVGAEQGLLLSDGSLLAADCVIAATGARAPHWLSSSLLQLNENGYIAVDAQHRSVSHPYVFAAGDVCARQDVTMARSGVHAVHAGPVLVANLLTALADEAPGLRQCGCQREGQHHDQRHYQTYQPRRNSLYLLACGPRYAIASWGAFSAEGAWVWRWKDKIDRGFIRKFSTGAEPRHTPSAPEQQ